MTEFEVEVFSSPAELPADAWNGPLPGGDIYLTHEWLSTVDRSIAQSSALLRVRSSRLGPVAGMAAYRMDHESFPFYDPVFLALTQDGTDELADGLTDQERSDLRTRLSALAAVRDQAYPVAVCVALFGYTTSAWLRPEAPGDALDALLNAFDQQAHAWGARSAALLYLPEDGLEQVTSRLVHNGYLGRTMDASCILPVKWATFDEYIGSLGKKRRDTTRREVRGFADAGITTSLESGEVLFDEPTCQRFAYLAALVYEKHGQDPEVERELDSLQRIRRNCQPYVRVLVARRGTEIIAFHLFYEVDAVLFSAMAGRDATVMAGSNFVYFNLIYELIRYGIDHGAHEINFGSGGYLAKLHRGCQLRRLNGFFRLPGPAVQIADLLELQDRGMGRLLAGYASGR